MANNHILILSHLLMDHTPMTTFTGHTKLPPPSESHKLLLATSEGEQKGMYQPIPSSRMTFTMTLLKNHS